MAKPVEVFCPHCKRSHALTSDNVKEVVRRELVSTEDGDFDAPMRELLYALLEDGGAKTLAKDLKDMLRSDQKPTIKLRAMEIIAGCIKHFEKMTPPTADLANMDAAELDDYITGKLNQPVVERPDDDGDNSPDWLRKTQRIAEMRRTGKPLNIEQVTDMVNYRYRDKAWFEQAVAIKEKDGSSVIVVYVATLLHVPKVLLMPTLGPFAGFTISIRQLPPGMVSKRIGYVETPRPKDKETGQFLSKEEMEEDKDDVDE